VFDDFLTGVERALVFHGFSGSHHHSSTDGINGVGCKTSSDGDSPTKQERSEERVFVGSEGGFDRVVQTEVEASINDDTDARDGETTVEPGNTIGGEGFFGRHQPSR